jgi:hypothetical protein
MEKRKALTSEPNVRIEDIMSAREGKSFELKINKFSFYF